MICLKIRSGSYSSTVPSLPTDEPDPALLLFLTISAFGSSEAAAAAPAAADDRSREDPAVAEGDETYENGCFKDSVSRSEHPKRSRATVQRPSVATATRLTLAFSTLLIFRSPIFEIDYARERDVFFLLDLCVCVCVCVSIRLLYGTETIGKQMCVFIYTFFVVVYLKLL